MHLPWKKKSRVSRFSHIVAGIQSPKHKSLVVETGFPTSLIDLFVKHRGRLKNSSSARKTQLEKDDGFEISRPELLSSPKRRVIEGEMLRQHDGEVIGGIQAVELLKKEFKRDCEVCDNGLELNCVLVWVLKVFVVVVLGMISKKLAVGITLSACFLMFVEYFGMGCGVRSGLESVSRNIGLWFVRFRNRKLVSRWSVLEENMCADRELCGSEMNFSGGEIEVVNNELDRVDQDFVEAHLGSSGQLLLKERLEFERKLELEQGYAEAVDCKKEHKGSGKKKSKMIKKFVQKKLRCRNKKNKGKTLEGASDEHDSVQSIDETFSSCHEQPEKEDDWDVHKQDSGKVGLLQVSQELKNHIKGSNSQEIIGPASDSGEVFKREAHTSAAEEKMDARRKQNYGYLFLFLIVLAGLLGGRMLAFVITMAWFSMQKLVNKLGRFENVTVKGSRARLE